MYLNRFWASVFGVAGYLFGIGLLMYIANIIGTFFGLLEKNALVTLILDLVLPVLAIAATRTYLDWKWGWKPANVGMALGSTSLVWTVIGLGAGALAAGLAHLLSAALTGGGYAVAFAGLGWPGLIALVRLLLVAFMVEMGFRGVAVSRYQTELPYKEMLLAAVLTPFAWGIVSRFFGFDFPAGIDSMWAAAMSVFLTLLFLRTDSVWLTFGLRAGMLLAIALLGLQVTQTAGLLVWGTGAVILAFLEWQKLQGRPRRPSPGKGPGRANRSRTIRGPWGPH